MSEAKAPGKSFLVEINEFKTERIGILKSDGMEHFYLRMDPNGVDGVTRVQWHEVLMGVPFFGFKLITDEDEYEELEGFYKNAERIRAS